MIRRFAAPTSLDFLEMALDGFQLRLDAMQGQLDALRAAVARLGASEDGQGPQKALAAPALTTRGKPRKTHEELSATQRARWTPEARAKQSARMKRLRKAAKQPSK